MSAPHRGDATGAGYRVQYHPLVVRQDIPKLDAVVQRRIKGVIEQKLTTHPEIFGIPLRRSLRGYRKLRVGDYRVVFRVSGATVYVLAMLHRSVVYDISATRQPAKGR